MNELPLVPADKLLPNRISLIPLESRPIFPGIFTPLMITDKDDVAVVEDALATTKVIGLLLLVEESEEGAPASEDRFFRVGTAAKILKKIHLPDGGLNIFVSTVKRRCSVR